MFELERLLITVRTYPNPSTKYIETVCTGGITDRGEWRRLYPVAHRYIPEDHQYRTFDVIEVKVRDGTDGRPETRRPEILSLKILSRLEHWKDRVDWIKPTILPSLDKMKVLGKTLAPVKVKEVLDFTAEKTTAEWSAAQKEKMKQEGLFDERKPLAKIPFDFRITWRDLDNVEHRSLVISWEFCETWRKYQQKYANPVEKMREIWIEDRCGDDRDVSFFMGNAAQHRQHFMICGIFHPPREDTVDNLFDNIS